MGLLSIFGNKLWMNEGMLEQIKLRTKRSTLKNTLDTSYLNMELNIYKKNNDRVMFA